MPKTRVAGMLAALLLFSGCCAPCRVPARPGAVGHVVICWLKQPGDAAACERLIRVSRSFAGMPGLLSVQAGRLLPTDRPIVDATFDVAIVLRFRDKQALAAYLEHPRHKRALRETLQPLARRVVVYDFVE